MGKLITLCVIALLGGHEPPQVWSALADCPALTKATRRDCVLALFRRHVRPGMPLSDLACLLGRPTWLKEENVHYFPFISGFVPVNWSSLKDSLYCLHIFPELDSQMGVVYFVVSGLTDYTETRGVAHLLCGTGGDAHANRLILDEACCDPEPAPRGARLPPLPAPAPDASTSSRADIR